MLRPLVLSAALAIAALDCAAPATPPPAVPVQSVAIPPASATPPASPSPATAAVPSAAASDDVAFVPPDAQRTPSGLATRVTSPGTGTVHPGPHDKVTVNYTGWTTDGKVFDTTTTRGHPATFTVSSLIKGWTEGLQLMVVGEKRRFWIPAELAYGQHPSRAGMPAGTLTFDVELVDLEVAPPPPPVPPDVAAAPPSATRTGSGLAYRVIKASSDPNAPKPTATSKVTVNYTGWTTDGTMFDSSVTRGKPAKFSLDHVIPGWTEGLQRMKVGDVVRFWIPGKLAYDDPAKPARAGAPHGTLVFDVELVGVE
jgi:peptidylprolyl isomerase